MKVLVLSGYGINCEEETLHAFETVGFKGKIIHVNDLIKNPKELDDIKCLRYQVDFLTVMILVLEMPWQKK